MTEPARAGQEGGARDQLLEAASQIMRERDRIDVSLSDLSERSGLNSALVKYYFGNKFGLLRALVDRDHSVIVQALESLMRRDMAPAEKLRRHLLGVIDTFHRYPYLNRLTMRMVRDCPDADAAEVADAFLKPIARAYDQLVGEGIASGVFRPVEPKHLYFIITGAADRFFNARLILQHCYDIEAMTDDMRDAYKRDVVDFVMRGILTDPASA